MLGSNSDWEFQIKNQIKKRYARQISEDNFLPDSAKRMAELGYSNDMISLLPDELQSAFSGCGCPISDLTFVGDEVVIDLGCGAGIDGFIASKLVPSGVVISVDFSFEMLKILQNHAQGTPVNVLASDLESLPLRSGIADYAISNAVFNLTPNKDTAYREMHRILKPRGKIALCDLVCNGELPREILENPTPDNVVLSLVYRVEHENFAEVIVSITNDTKNNTNKLFNSEEINISRKITKGEGSTYKVNDQEVRQRDVQIMFADQSTGSKSNAIVDQGQVAKIINSKPEDRRKILEEAAGISGIHARKHETELKLNSTESNLEKLSEVIESDKIRLKELLKQSSQANKYKYLSEQIRELEAQILYYKLEEAKNTFRINDEKLQEYALNVSKLTRKNEELLKHKKKIEKNLPELRQTEQNIASKLNKLEIREKLLDADSSKIIEN